MLGVSVETGEQVKRLSDRSLWDREIDEAAAVRSLLLRVWYVHLGIAAVSYPL